MSHVSLPYVFVRKSELASCAIVRGNQRQYKPNRSGAAYDFRMRLQIAGPGQVDFDILKKTRAHREPALSKSAAITRSHDQQIVRIEDDASLDRGHRNR